MKKVEAVIQGFKADEVREALAHEKIPRITVFEVRGAGRDQGPPKAYRGARYIEDSAEVKFEFVVDDDAAERIAESIINTLRSGELGEGEVVIAPIEQVLRLRVGQHGHRVSNWQDDRAPAYLMRNRTTVRSYLGAIRRKFHEAG
jgi:nitrogen regulatory protein PII